ncbi:hypothetical protein GmRootV116_30880 [Variovorax sp. V116]
MPQPTTGRASCVEGMGRVFIVMAGRCCAAAVIAEVIGSTATSCRKRARFKRASKNGTGEKAGGPKFFMEARCRHASDEQPQ